MIEILSVVGARPQFIKAFPVSLALADTHSETLVHTGQHYDRMLSDVFFEELDVPEPAHHLDVGSEPAGTQIGRMMEGLQPIVDEISPDVVLTYGDTHTTVAAAIVAAHSEALLAHIEAGLRSHNRAMPEEINRAVTDHAADLLFAPTDRAVEALDREGITSGVHLTGDVMVDAMRWTRDMATQRSTALETFDLEPREYFLTTVHRQSNTDEIARLRRIIRTLGALEYPVIFPAHPRTVDRLEDARALDWARQQINLVQPVGYIDFIELLANARRVITDSGGIQKEAFLLDTPCVTLREETEWPETVEAGWNTLVGADANAIEAAIEQPFRIEDKPQPYGDGTAAAAIRQQLEIAVYDGHGIREPVPSLASDAQSLSTDYQSGN